MNPASNIALPSRSEVARHWKQEGGLIGAILPIHYPRSLLRAFNILPIEVWGPPKVDATQGAIHIQPYICSVVRNAISFLQTGGLDVADLIVIPHTCDSLQGMGSILLDFVQPSQPVIPIYLPRGMDERAIHFLVEEFKSFYRELELIAQCSPTDDELMETVLREEDADEWLIRLHQNRGGLNLSDYEFYRLIRAREYLPAEIFAQFAQTALFEHRGTSRGGIPILLSGILPEPMDLLLAIAKFGGCVVADDLASCGRRLYAPGKSDQALIRMVERILSAPPGWSLGNPIQGRLEHILDLIDDSDARGVVFHNIMFCEPELFDLPDLRKGLQEHGVPSITIEVDLNDSLSSQAHTRIEAFLEMIA